MEKQKHNNGFTLIEMMIVLLIISILSLSYQPRLDYSLSMFMEKVKICCINSQQLAFIEKKDIYVTFSKHSLIYGDEEFIFPDGIVCDEKTFHYNSNGNISTAQTIHCSNQHKEKKLVFQLGMGRIRIE